MGKDWVRVDVVGLEGVKVYIVVEWKRRRRWGWISSYKPGGAEMVKRELGIEEWGKRK